MSRKITGTVETIEPVAETESATHYDVVTRRFSAEIDAEPRHPWGLRLLVGVTAAVLALAFGAFIAWWGI